MRAIFVLFVRHEPKYWLFDDRLCRWMCLNLSQPFEVLSKSLSRKTPKYRSCSSRSLRFRCRWRPSLFCYALPEILHSLVLFSDRTCRTFAAVSLFETANILTPSNPAEAAAPWPPPKCNAVLHRSAVWASWAVISMACFRSGGSCSTCATPARSRSRTTQRSVSSSRSWGCSTARCTRTPRRSGMGTS
jgi:hypothetical protein